MIIIESGWRGLLRHQVFKTKRTSYIHMVQRATLIAFGDPIEDRPPTWRWKVIKSRYGEFHTPPEPSSASTLIRLHIERKV